MNHIRKIICSQNEYTYHSAPPCITVFSNPRITSNFVPSGSGNQGYIFGRNRSKSSGIFRVAIDDNILQLDKLM